MEKKGKAQKTLSRAAGAAVDRRRQYYCASMTVGVPPIRTWHTAQTMIVVGAAEAAARALRLEHV